MSDDSVAVDGLRYRWKPARTKVIEQPPAEVRMSLALVATGHETGWFVANDVIYIGTWKGDEVAYRVTGWDDDAKRLIMTLATAP